MIEETEEISIEINGIESTIRFHATDVMSDFPYTRSDLHKKVQQEQNKLRLYCHITSHPMFVQKIIEYLLGLSVEFLSDNTCLYHKAYIVLKYGKLLRTQGLSLS